MDDKQFQNLSEDIKKNGNDNMRTLLDQHILCFEDKHVSFCKKLNHRINLSKWWKQFLINKKKGLVS